ELAREHVGRAALDLSLGGNRLQLAGDYGRAGDVLNFAIDASDLAAVDADLGGRLTASGRIGGAWAHPSLAFTARGEALRFASLTTASLVADADIGAQGAGDDERSIRIAAVLTDAQANSVALSRLSARVTGTVAQHDLAIVASGADFDLDARLAGGWRTAASPDWSGRIVALENRGQYPLALAGSARVDWQRDHIRVADAAGLALGLSRFEIAAESVDDHVHATLTARARLADADVAVDIGSSPKLAGRFDGAAPLKLSVHIDAASLRAMQALTGTAAIVDGRLPMNLAGQGT